MLGGASLLLTMIGASAWVNDVSWGPYVNYLGIAGILLVLYFWFGDAISESEQGLYSGRIDPSFRWSMSWFIFSEVMSFAAFFGALFYARGISIPWLGGDNNNFFTNALLWTAWTATLPTNGPGDVGGAFPKMGAGGVPALQPAILRTSGVTLTIAHHAMQEGKRRTLGIFLAATFILGFIFMVFQAYEYIHGYSDLNLTLNSGIYGTTFYMLTGFHGLHVTLGATMLTVIMIRAMKGHFTEENHFAFEAVAWYWHFVDVVWLGLFVFVYWLV